MIAMIMNFRIVLIYVAILDDLRTHRLYNPSPVVLLYAPFSGRTVHVLQFAVLLLDPVQI